MNVSKRLKTIASFINKKDYVIDVGCDHALLDIYLVTNSICNKAIASDINELPLKSAIDNIKKYNLEDKIKVIKQDGIKSLDNKVNTIVISGMGTTNIINILFKDKSKLDNIKKIIISSNNDYYELRKTFIKNNYYIKEETIVLDKNKYYPIIVFEKGNKKYSYISLKYGPLLIKEKSDIFMRYINKEIKKFVKIDKSLSIKYIIKKIRIKKEIKCLKNI